MSVRRQPSLLWRLFVLVGVGSLAAASLSDDVWEKVEDTVGDAIPRSTIRSVLFATLGLHAVESLLVFRSAKRRGDAGPGRWAFWTLLWGFPVMGRLRTARKAESMAIEAVALADEAVALAEAA